MINTCKNCGNQFEGKFCNQCGEKVFTVKDKNIFFFFEQFFHFITHFEGTFFTTLKAIITKPGQLSADFCDGIRKKYFKPASFFLILVIFYLLFPMFSGLNMPLEGHRGQIYKGYVNDKANTYLTTHPDVTIDMLSQKFSSKSEKTSKLLLFLIIPFTAIPLWIAGRKKRPLFYDALCLATEANSFFLFFAFLIMPLIVTLSNWISSLFSTKFYLFNELTLAISIYTIFTFFMLAAVRRFYPGKRKQQIWITVLFLLFHPPIVYILYKFILFVAVFYQIN